MTKASNFYIKADNLFGTSYNRLRIHIPTGYHEGKVDYGLFNEVYRILPKVDKRNLTNLLERLVNTVEIINSDKLSFKVEGIKELGETRSTGYNFSVYFTDNINGDTLLFVPTYAHAVKIVGERHIILDSNEDKIKENRLVFCWKECWTMPGVLGSDYRPTEHPSEIKLYFPESYVEKNGILIYSKNKKGAEEEIKKFKVNLKEKFVQNNNSPIIYNIERILEMGYNLLEKKRREIKKGKDSQEMNFLVNERI